MAYKHDDKQIQVSDSYPEIPLSFCEQSPPLLPSPKTTSLPSPKLVSTASDAFGATVYLNLRTLCNALSADLKHEWIQIGVQLGIPYIKLMEFKKEDDPLIAVFDYWLEGNVKDVPVSWRSIVQALSSDLVGRFDLALKIEAKYCGQTLERKATFLVSDQEGKLVLSTSTQLKSLYTTESQPKLENDMGEIKLKFKHLLKKVTNFVKDKPPHELATLLSCYDDHYCTLTKDCQDTNDVITALLENISFLDYGLLHFIAKGLEDTALYTAIELYKTDLEDYILNRLYYKKIDNYVYSAILPLDTSIHKRQIGQLKVLAQRVLNEHRELYPNADIIIASPVSDDSESRSPKVLSELRGIDVVQEIKVHVTNSAQLFEWKGYGLKLNIPEQSLPTNEKSCIITIKASFSGQYEFPHNTNLVSPIFWLQCEPNFKFKEPLTLEVEHCASPENSFRLFMARAQCTQTDLPYSFKTLPGGTFNRHSSYGTIDLNNFSGTSVVQEKSGQRLYWSKVFYMGLPNNRIIHFTVTWHLNARITTVEKKYSSRKALPGPEQSFKFKENSISLAIPKDGINLKEGWKVIPTFLPEIDKEEVDHYRPANKAVPHCELVATWTNTDNQLNLLQHTVNILGTTKERYFVINIDPGAVMKDAGLSLPQNDSQNKLEIRHLHTIHECLKDLTRDKVIEVGLALGLYYPHLTNMSNLSHDMILAWLQRSDGVLEQSGQPTTQSLIKALEKSDLTGTADIVRSKFIIIP